MGNALSLCFSSRIPESYLKPAGLYATTNVDLKRLRKLILKKKLAPCYPGQEVDAEGTDLDGECPICFLSYPALNRTKCCQKEVCTECFLQVKLQAIQAEAQRPGNTGHHCPFCKSRIFQVVFAPKTEEERQQIRREAQRIKEAQEKALREEQERNERRWARRRQQQEQERLSAGVAAQDPPASVTPAGAPAAAEAGVATAGELHPAPEAQPPEAAAASELPASTSEEPLLGANQPPASTARPEDDWDPFEGYRHPADERIARGILERQERQERRARRALAAANGLPGGAVDWVQQLRDQAADFIPEDVLQSLEAGTLQGADLEELLLNVAILSSLRQQQEAQADAAAIPAVNAETDESALWEAFGADGDTERQRDEGAAGDQERPASAQAVPQPPASASEGGAGAGREPLTSEQAAATTSSPAEPEGLLSALRDSMAARACGLPATPATPRSLSPPSRAAREAESNAAKPPSPPSTSLPPSPPRAVPSPGAASPPLVVYRSRQGSSPNAIVPLTYEPEEAGPSAPAGSGSASGSATQVDLAVGSRETSAVGVGAGAESGRGCAVLSRSARTDAAASSPGPGACQGEDSSEDLTAAWAGPNSPQRAGGRPQSARVDATRPGGPPRPSTAATARGVGGEGAPRTTPRAKMLTESRSRPVSPRMEERGKGRASADGSKPPSGSPPGPASPSGVGLLDGLFRGRGGAGWEEAKGREVSSDRATRAIVAVGDVTARVRAADGDAAVKGRVESSDADVTASIDDADRRLREAFAADETAHRS